MITKIQSTALYLLLICIGLNGGLHFFGILAPIEFKLTAAQFASYWQVTDDYMGQRMPYFGFSTLILFVINLVLFRKSWRTLFFWLIAASFILMVMDLVFTIKEQLPINQYIQKIDVNNLTADQLKTVDEMRLLTLKNFDFRNYLALVILLAIGLTPFLLPKLNEKRFES